MKLVNPQVAFTILGLVQRQLYPKLEITTSHLVKMRVRVLAETAM